MIFSSRMRKAKNDLCLMRVHSYFGEDDWSCYSRSFLLHYLLPPIFVVEVHFSKIKSLSLIVPSSGACLMLMLWTNWCWCCISSNYTSVCPWSFLAAHLVLDCIPHLIRKQLLWHYFSYFSFASLAEMLQRGFIVNILIVFRSFIIDFNINAVW